MKPETELSFHAQVWEKFTNIDVKPMIDKNNQVDYLTWSKVWRLIMQHYPESTYSFTDRRIPGIGDNGPAETVEVSCSLVIKSGDSEAARTMHLPCMQSYGQFLAIENPTARHISDTRMRCLVKAAAMFGLGLTMWSGDEFQAAKDVNKKALEFGKMKSDFRMGLWKTAIVIKESCANDQASVALEAWQECNENEMKWLWLAESKGGFFTQAEKSWFKSLRMVNNAGE